MMPVAYYSLSAAPLCHARAISAAGIGSRQVQLREVVLRDKTRLPFWQTFAQ